MGAVSGTAAAIGVWLGLSVIATLAAIPDPVDQPPAPARRWRRPFARLAYLVCVPLTVLRLPYAVVPHVLKVAVLLLTGPTGDRWWNRRSVQLVRTLGDWINLGVTGFFLAHLVASGSGGVAVAGHGLFVASTAAEIVRLVAEKGQMLFSAGWQSLPHRHLAGRLGPSRSGPLRRYCWFYALDDQARAEAARRWLQRRCQRDPETSQRLGYVTGTRLVDPDVVLWSGVVREVATGEVLAHPHWTADPGLLMGQLLRRSPWIFDPRLQRRPIRYRTGTNVAMTMMVLENVDLLGAYGIYQWGNQIKVARYEIFHHLCRAIGVDREQVLLEDGSFDFTPPDLRVARRFSGVRQSRQRPLWTDAEVLTQLESDPELRDPVTIGSRYCYPERYVREVLLPAVGA